MTQPPGPEAHGDQIAWAQLHSHLLHPFEDKHAERVLKDGGMPRVNTYQPREDTQPARSGRAQRRQRGKLLGVANLPERQQGALQDKAARSQQASQNLGIHLRCGDGKVQLLTCLRQRFEPFRVDPDRDAPKRVSSYDRLPTPGPRSLVSAPLFPSMTNGGRR